MSERVHLGCCGGPRYTAGSYLELGENIGIPRQNTVTPIKTKIISCNTDIQLNCFSVVFVLNHNF